MSSSPPPSDWTIVLRSDGSDADPAELRAMRPNDPAPLCLGPLGCSGHHATRGDVTLLGDVRLDDRERLGRELGLHVDETTARDDADLALLAYERWGEDFASRLVGAFALALWDAPRGVLVAARDHMGFRPLHYWQGRAGLVMAPWAEGVLAHPAVPRTPDPEALAARDANAPPLLRERSLFKGIRKLAPGGLLTFRSDQPRPRLSRHWEPSPRSDPGVERPEDCVALLRETLRAAVADAVRDGEPTGAHLSGGVDSSTVAVLADEELRRRGGRLVRGYSWAPPPEGATLVEDDERPRVERIAATIGVPLTFATLGGAEQARVEALEAALAPAVMQLSEGVILRDAAERGLRVLLSGWGGDEVASFNGRGWVASVLRERGLRAATGQAWEMAVGHGARGHRRITGTAGFLWYEGMIPLLPDRAWVALGFDRRRYRRGGARHKRSRDAAQRTAQRLARLDGRDRPGVRASQIALLNHGHLTARIESWAWSGDRVGITYRYPLLDRRVLDLCLALPEGLWWHQGQRRWLFRAVAEGILPPGIPSSAVKHEPALMEAMKTLQGRESRSRGRSSSATLGFMRRIPQRDLRNDVSSVLRRVMAGERLRVTVAGHDAADLVPIDESSPWTSGARAREVIAAAQADRGLATELEEAFPDTTDDL